MQWTGRRSTAGGLTVREHGGGGPPVVVLHGGPGAPGTMAPVARGLAGRFRVLEPFQRTAGGPEPLTVARHVADLAELIEQRCGRFRPAVVGHSWGAMLALAFAAAHPQAASSLVLLGCGTFDPEAREWLQATRERRMDARLRRRLARLDDEVPDPDERLRAMGELLAPVDSYELAAPGPEAGGDGTSRLGAAPGILRLERCDSRGHRETWADMMRQEEAGVFPAAFAAIEAPVLMLHGTADPHPGRMIRASLVPHLPQLVFREWERCGHYPWLEKAARSDLFRVLRGWLDRFSPEERRPR